MRTKAKRYLIFAVALITAVIFCLSSCGKGNKFSMDGDGKYVDKKTNISYIDAPFCYEPIYVSDKVYGTLDKVPLYEIEGADPEKWLCEQSGTVFYADSVRLPTLEEMNVSYALVMLEEVTLANISDRGEIEGLVDAYTNGISLQKPYWSDGSYRINWRIRFADETIGVYYIIAYLEVDEDYIVTLDDGTEVNYGRKFFYNRFDEGRLVPAGDLLDGYVEEYNELNKADDE